MLLLAKRSRGAHARNDWRHWKLASTHWRCRSGASSGCVRCEGLARHREHVIELRQPWTFYSGYVWCLSRRRRNKEYYSLHGNPTYTCNSFDGFSADAQLGIGILRARAAIASPREAADARHCEAADSGGDDGFHSAHEIDSVGPCSHPVAALAGGELPFNSREPRVISLSDALHLDSVPLDEPSTIGTARVGDVVVADVVLNAFALAVYASWQDIGQTQKRNNVDSVTEKGCRIVELIRACSVQ